MESLKANDAKIIIYELTFRRWNNFWGSEVVNELKSFKERAEIIIVIDMMLA